MLLEFTPNSHAEFTHRMIPGHNRKPFRGHDVGRCAPLAHIPGYKWKDDPAALPSQVAASLQQQSEPGFSQFNNPAQGGLSAEGVTPGVSDRVTVTGVDKAGLEVQ